MRETRWRVRIQVVDRDDGGDGAVGQAHTHRVHHELLSITWMIRVAVPIIGGSPVRLNHGGIWFYEPKPHHCPLRSAR